MSCENLDGLLKQKKGVSGETGEILINSMI